MVPFLWGDKIKIHFYIIIPQLLFHFSRMVITETQGEDYWFFKLNMEIYTYLPICTQKYLFSHGIGWSSQTQGKKNKEYNEHCLCMYHRPVRSEGHCPTRSINLIKSLDLRLSLLSSYLALLYRCHLPVTRTALTKMARTPQSSKWVVFILSSLLKQWSQKAGAKVCVYKERANDAASAFLK